MSTYDFIAIHCRFTFTDCGFESFCVPLENNAKNSGFTCIHHDLCGRYIKYGFEVIFEFDNILYETFSVFSESVQCDTFVLKLFIVQTVIYIVTLHYYVVR